MGESKEIQQKLYVCNNEFHDLSFSLWQQLESERATETA